MTGEGRLVGGGDDYTLQLELVADCTQAAIEVFFDPAVAALAVCRHSIEEAFPQAGVKIHYRVVKDPSLPKIYVGVRQNEPWDYSIVVHFSGFETGDTSEWSSAQP